MRTAIKPNVVKRVDFTIPRGIIDQGYSNWDSIKSRYVFTHETPEDALKARSIQWDYSGQEGMGVTITKIKDKLLFLVGEPYGDDNTITTGNEYFKLTPKIAKKLILRALASEVGKEVRPTEAEKAEVRSNKRGPCFERVPGRGNLFLFTAPCGDVSVLKEATLKSMIEAIELAEKELR